MCSLSLSTLGHFAAPPQPQQTKQPSNSPLKALCPSDCRSQILSVSSSSIPWRTTRRCAACLPSRFGREGHPDFCSTSSSSSSSRSAPTATERHRLSPLQVWMSGSSALSGESPANCLLRRFRRARHTRPCVSHALLLLLQRTVVSVSGMMSIISKLVSFVVMKLEVIQ